MISPEQETGCDLPANGSCDARAAWHARERRKEAAHRALCSMSTEDRTAGAAPAAPAARSLGLSKCHISPWELFPTPLHAWAHSPRAEELNQKCHGEYLDARAARDKKRRVRLYYEGTLIRIDGIPGWEEYERETKSKRGAVSGFSGKSRSRMLALVSSLNRQILPIFVTLTYDDEWDNDPLAWKSDLDTFGKWLLRAYPQSCFIWKLEPQKRGAPHFHLLVYGIPFLPWQAVAVRWVEIVNQCRLPKNFPVEKGRLGAAAYRRWVVNNIENYDVMNHLLAGVRVEAIRSRNGVMCYCSKNYMGKECELPAGWEKVGRFWGVIGRKNLPRSKVEEIEFSREAFSKVRRVARRWFAAKGMRRRSGNALTLYTSAHWQWVRVLELAETGTTIARDWIASPP